MKIKNLKYTLSAIIFAIPITLSACGSQEQLSKVDVSSLEQEIANLEEKNADLEKKNANLEEENARLRDNLEQKYNEEQPEEIKEDISNKEETAEIPEIIELKGNYQGEYNTEIISFGGNCHIELKENISKEAIQEILAFLEENKSRIKELKLTGNMDYFVNRNAVEVDKDLLQKISELENIVSLKLFYVKNLDLSSIANLKKLNALTLSACDFIDLEALKSFPSLISLNFLSCDIEDVKVISEITKLRNLGIYDVGQYNHSLKNLNSLTNLKELKDLSLCGDNLKDISDLEELKGLSWLSLNMNEIEDIEPLSKLTKLYTIDLMYNNITDISPLAEVETKELLFVDLSNNPISNPSILGLLKNDQSHNLEIFLSSDANISELEPLIETFKENSVAVYVDSRKLEDYFLNQQETTFQKKLK